MRWKYANTVLLLTMLAFFITFFARLAISPVVPFITAEFSLSNTQIGFALSGLWLAYGLAQFPSGMLADRIGEKTVILIAVGGTAVTSILLAIAPFFGIFVVAVVLLGAVAGLHYSVATTLLSRTHDDIGAAIGIHSLGAPLAGLIAPVTAAWIGVRYGWRPAVAIVVVIALPIFLLIYWRIRPTEPRRPNEPIRERLVSGSVFSLLARPETIFTLILAVLATFVLNGLLTFLPTFLMEHRGLPPTLAAGLFAGYFVVRGVGQISIGSISDTYGRDFAIAICMGSGSIGFALMTVGPGMALLVAAVVLAGIGASFFPAIDPRFLDQFPESSRNAGFGLVRTIYGVIGATGSIGLGFFSDVFGWAIGMGILATLYTFALVIISLNWGFKLGY